MTLRTALWTLAVLLVSTSAVFVLFQRSLGGAWFSLGIHPEVVEALDRSLEDQKALARLDPDGREAYHRRFAEIETLRNHLRILEHNRDRIVRRYEVVLLVLLVTIVLAAGGVSLLRQGRAEARLARLRPALEALSAGRTDVSVDGGGRRDLIGRMAAMIEETSRVMARDRRRLATLRDLSAWQEAARRHAHEIRTPLTAARLELERLRDLAADTALPEAPRQTLARLAEGLGHELDRLGAFTQGFTSFARLPRPQTEERDLVTLCRELVATFVGAWPELTLTLAAPPGPCPAAVDGELLRQVLVNLCDNSARALAESGTGEGSVTLRPAVVGSTVVLDVEDDGPGIPAELGDRLFEPYATSRRSGEGMGLGLAISKKILLDHGGDLELLRTSGAGTTFRLSLPRARGVAT